MKILHDRTVNTGVISKRAFKPYQHLVISVECGFLGAFILGKKKSSGKYDAVMSTLDI